MKIMVATIAILIASGLYSSVAWGEEQRASTPEQKQVAIDHFKRGKRAYNAKQYEVALAEFRAAMSVIDKPKIHYNIGLALTALGRCEEAVTSFRQYVRGMVAEGKELGGDPLISLEECAVAYRAATVFTGAPAATRPRSLQTPAIVLGVLAAASGATALGLNRHIENRQRHFNASCEFPCQDSEIERLKHQAMAEYALWGFSGLATGVSVVLGALEGVARQKQRRLKVQPSVSRNRASVALTYSF